MALWNLGSINIDHVYRLPHIPAAGETIAARSYAAGLGGKGANQSVAAARAGARVHHIGAIGPEGAWTVALLAGYGIDTGAIQTGPEPTGHAIIAVDDAGENAILLHPGANLTLTAAQVAKGMAQARPGDTLLLQNETSAQAEAAALAAARGLRVIYSAAPYDTAAVRQVLLHAHLLVMNAGEAAALRAALGALPPTECLITHGSQGAEWILADGQILRQPAFPVTPVDTTGAGDTFIGWLAAELDLGRHRDIALRRAAAAAALQVTRPGAAAAIPLATEVDTLLASATP
jgi:ribokinase